MASEILGFFTTPQQYQQNQLAQARSRAFQEVQLDPFQQAALGARTAGYQLGQGIGGALGGEDPQLQLIARRQQLLSQLDQSDPTSFARVAKMASDAGDQELAFGVANAGREAAVKIAQANKERQGADPFQQLLRAGKFTPESLAKYQETGNVADLRDIEKTKDDVVVVGNALVSKSTGLVIYQGEKPEKYSDFARKLIEFGLTPGTEPFQKRMLEHINALTKGASQGTGNVFLGGISVDTGAAAKEAGKVIGGNVANIESQYSLQTGIGDALKLIDKGIYAGAYGPEKGFIAKYSLGTVGDPKKVRNTEVFMANIGEIVIPRLQQFGGNDSNEELKYLQKVVAGDQRLEPESMQRILISAEKKIANNIRRLQKQAESAGKGGNLPLEPMQPTPSQPKANKRYNPQTKKVEVITGD
jgi:hypothetical protein